MGTSLWLCRRRQLLVLLGDRLEYTNSTLALPLSLTLKGKEVSSPDAVSSRLRNAWCGRFAALPSCVVRMTFNVSCAPKVTALDTALDSESLKYRQQSLFLRSISLRTSPSSRLQRRCLCPAPTVSHRQSPSLTLQLQMELRLQAKDQ